MGFRAMILLNSVRTICFTTGPGKKNGSQVARILFLLLLTTTAWPCLKNSRNLGTIFLPGPVNIPSDLPNERSHFVITGGSDESFRRRSNEVPGVADWVRTRAVRQAIKKFKNGRNGTDEELKTLLGLGNVDR